MLPGGGRRGAAARHPLQVEKSVTLLGKCLRPPEWGILNAGIWGGYRARVLSWTMVSF